MNNRRVWIILFLGLVFILLSKCNILAPVSDPNGPSPDFPERPVDPAPTDDPVITPQPDVIVDNPVISPTPVDDPKLDKEDLFRLSIVDYAKEYQGTNYLYAGRDPKKGFDCSGFTYFVMDHFDISLSASSRAQEGQGRKISVNKVQPGDLIFFRRSADSNVFHVSLVVDNSSAGILVIHSTSRGVVIDNISKSSYWAPKISTARDVVSSKF